MTVDFERTEYQSGITHTNIPYTIYVHENRLLLVPREVNNVHRERVSFGYEEDEGVVVCTLLPGSNLIPYWDFRTTVNSDKTVIKKHFTDQTSDPDTSFVMMQADLAHAA
ncbi:hypothetical protein BX600DRAFT_508666 [Xylariales sp. PMI_506]|nr:hypothetical protein BX600DRAFT_508666 [Xylariales sp. PMI_506]